MKLTQEILLLLRNTLLVTLAVILGFTVGSAFGLPAWLQGLCLIPAGWLFYRLSGEKAPRPGEWIPFIVTLGLIVQCGVLLFPLVPSEYLLPAFLLLIFFAPVRRLESWVRRLVTRFERKSGA